MIRRFLERQQLEWSSTCYFVVGAMFSTIVVLSNILSAKFVCLCAFNHPLPAGLLIYPFSFVLTNLITELYGKQKARLMTYTALGMSLLSFCFIKYVLWMPSFGEQEAFELVLGLSGLRIFSSMTSYVISQLVDIQIYSAIKQWTGLKWIWMRNNGSMLVSQLVDTVLIDVIFLWWGLGMSFLEIYPIMLFSYFYKMLFSLGGTPILYLAIGGLKKGLSAK